MGIARNIARLIPNGSGVLSDANAPSGSVIQVVSNNWNTNLAYGSADGSGVNHGSGFTVIPSNGYVNITSSKANSTFLVIFDGNLSTSNDTNQIDWIGGFGFVVDPAGGTSWTRIGSGTNTGTNIKFFSSRAQPNQNTAGGDGYWAMPANASVMHSPNVAANTSLRFAVEYFHYDNGQHETLFINRRSANTTGVDVYNGNLATTLTVMEIAS